MVTFDLFFARGQLVAQEAAVELVETRFTAPLVVGPLVSVRGRRATVAGATGTFQWSAAVQALSLLFVATKLSTLPQRPSSLALLSGGRGSPAASLDFSLSKMPLWLTEMFGVDSKGDSILRRVLQTTNSNQKRPGPVEIAINPNFLAPRSISIFIDNEEVTSSADLEALYRTLGGTSEAALTEPVVPRHPAPKAGKPPPLTRMLDTEAPIFPYVAQGSDSGTTVGFVLEDLALRILISHEQLTAGELRSLIREDAGTSIDSRWIEQRLTEMQHRGIIERHGLTFSASARVKAELAELLPLLSSPEDTTTPAEGRRLKQNNAVGASLEVKSLALGDQLIFPLYSAFINRLPVERSVLWHLSSAWWPLAHPWSAVKRATRLAGPPASYVIPGSSAVDGWVRGTYQNVGVAGHLGVQTPYHRDFWLGESILLWIEMEAELLAELRRFIDSAKDIEAFDEGKFRRGILEVSSSVRLNLAVMPKTVELLRAEFAQFLPQPARAA